MSGTKRKRPAHLLLAQHLGVGIVEGRYAPGDLLPSEVSFAASFGVSRGVLREALRTLAAKGLIESRPKTGTRIRDRRAWNLLDPELLGWVFDASPTLHFVQSLFQLRLIVEPAAAEIAARRRNERQLAAMAAALETIGKHGLHSDLGRTAESVFHELLLEATDNELLVSLSSGISAAVRCATLAKYRQGKPPLDATPVRAALFGAIGNGDASGARAAMMTLVQQAQSETEAAIKSAVARA